MPTKPKKSKPDHNDLVDLSRNLKRRLSSSIGKKSRGNISAEFQKELLGALDCLAQLAAESPSGKFSSDSVVAISDYQPVVSSCETSKPASNQVEDVAIGATDATEDTQSVAESNLLPAQASRDLALSESDSSSEDLTSDTSAGTDLADSQHDLADSQPAPASFDDSQPTDTVLPAAEPMAVQQDSDNSGQAEVESTAELCSGKFASAEIATEEIAATEIAATEISATKITGEVSLLEGLVARSVAQSLGTFQQQITESIVRALSITTQTLDSQHLQSLVLELESELRDTRFQLQAANDLLTECKAELKFYREQTEAESSIFDLDRSVGNLVDASQPDEQVIAADDKLLLELQQQLEEARIEMAELREQNSDLAAKLAHQVACAATSDKQTGRGIGEQLTWEERKMLILKQLNEDSTHDADPIPHEERLSIQEVLDATQSEIARRDEEIQELREIVRMQSEAREGVAIGAAGVAQLLDSDELIQQERQKLREIQEEWEAKLRQAEIDLSMERAKIARERIALEKQKEEAAKAQPVSQTNAKGKIKERRWLNILGLGEGGPE